MNQLDAIFRTAADPTGFARGYLDYLGRVLAAVDAGEIGRFIAVMMDARRRGARIFFIGNGGSAATASHFANDLAIGTRSPERPFRALSLTDNMAVISAIGNDDGFEQIFVQQLEAQAEAGDVLVAISASGNSPNIVKAVEWAQAHGLSTIGLTAFDGGALRRLAQVSVHIPTNKGEYGPAEDGHMVLDHLVGAYLMRAVRAERAVTVE